MKCAAFKGSGTFSSYMIKTVYIVVGKRPNWPFTTFRRNY